jgi:hypothetical protein
MQLKELPLDKPDANELHPDVNIREPPVAFHNYLDEFLQAIRVFGFLEKPVCHTLVINDVMTSHVGVVHRSSTSLLDIYRREGLSQAIASR